MGVAFHRKKIPLGRGTKTHGTGIGYWDKSTQAFTTTSIANGKPDEPPNVRNWNVHCLMTLAARTLDDWEDALLNGADSNPITERICDKALTIVNTAVTKYCDKNGIEVEHLIQSLRRSRRSAELQAALSVVSKRFSSVFDTVAATGKS